VFCQIVQISINLIKIININKLHLQKIIMGLSVNTRQVFDFFCGQLLLNQNRSPKKPYIFFLTQFGARIAAGGGKQWPLKKLYTKPVDNSVDYL
jgi:hypothetical protein